MSLVSAAMIAASAPSDLALAAPDPSASATLSATASGSVTPSPSVTSSPSTSPSPSPSPSHSGGPTPILGQIGAYKTGYLKFTIAEPAHGSVGARSLLTVVRWPILPSGSKPEKFPLIVFAPGYMQCDSPYRPLLLSIASAGYVVAAVNFPRTDCHAGPSLRRADLINEPHDLSYAITKLISLSAAGTGTLSGLIDPKEIGAYGHSDGGVVIGLLAANTCCADHQVDASAIDAGAFWSTASGSYFAHQPAPMLFEQGSADAINNPVDSVVMYDSDPSLSRYYLDLLGASHTGPVWGSNATERLNALITTEFFDKWLLKQSTEAAMKRDGNKRGVAILVSGGQAAP